MPPADESKDNLIVAEQGDGPGSDSVKVKAAGIVSLLILALALVAVISLLVMAMLGVFYPLPQADIATNTLLEAETLAGADDWMDEAPPAALTLYWPWRLFLWLSMNGGIVGNLIGGVVALVAVGIKAIADHNDRVWAAVSLIVACLIGFAVSIILMAQLSDSSVVNELSDFTDKSDGEFVTAVQVTLGLLALWFGGFAARQVGIEPAKDIIKRVKKAISGSSEGET